MYTTVRQKNTSEVTLKCILQWGSRTSLKWYWSEVYGEEEVGVAEERYVYKKDKQLILLNSAAIIRMREKTTGNYQ